MSVVPALVAVPDSFGKAGMPASGGPTFNCNVTSKEGSANVSLPDPGSHARSGTENRSFLCLRVFAAAKSGSGTQSFPTYTYS